MSLEALIEQGTVSREHADWLLRQLEAGSSLVVAARASGAGKSTLAHALSERLPPDRPRIYLRGMAEPFDWVDAAVSPPTLLVNEMSDHLPFYCWGPCARRVLELATAGVQVIATLHADSVGEIAALLRWPEIGATAREIVALNIVVFLDMAPGTDRRSIRMERIELDPGTGRAIGRPVEI